jgi:predicted RNA-binding Zn-ribbon protein involved in translation (DUF1610 family)
MCPAETSAGPEMRRGAPHPAGEESSCVRCGYPVPDRPLGCRWPCPNCGFLYPQGDCSD